MGLACIGFTAATITFIGNWWDNKKRDERRSEYPAVIEQSIEELGDEHPDFRFVQ